SRTPPDQRAEILHLILDVYATTAASAHAIHTAAVTDATTATTTAPAAADPADATGPAGRDEEVIRLLALSFSSLRRRSLAFHLAQATLSFSCYREIARLLEERLSGYHRTSGFSVL